MAIPRKQIGWSQESNLLWEISRQMEKLTGVAFNGGGGGSALTIKDDGTTLTTGATSIDFTGAGVTASATGTAVTVNIPGGGSGTVNVDGVTIGGDGSSESPLYTNMPVTNDINLQLGTPFQASTEGIYRVTTGTDVNDPYYFLFSDSTSSDIRGKRMIIINADPINPIYSSSFRLLGTDKYLSIIPPLATYELVYILTGGGWQWACINPGEVTFEVDLTSGSYDIRTFGIYKITDSDGINTLTFPDPNFFKGHSITVINNSPNNSVPIVGSVPSYQSFIGNLEFVTISAGMIVKFVSTGYYWQSEPSTQEITVSRDLNDDFYLIPGPGIYKIIPSVANELYFPNPVGMEGLTITVWNTSDTDNILINSTYSPVSPDNSSISSIAPFTIFTFKCIFGQWVASSLYSI